MNIEIFNIKWKNIGDNLTPYFWRDVSIFTPDTKAPVDWLPNFIYSIVIALENLTDRLFTLAFNANNRLIYSGQVQVLNISLNDYFDSDQRRIFISDAAGVSNSIFSLYEQPETNPQFWDLYLNGESDPEPKTFYLTSAGDYDFIVNVPSGLSFDQPQMEALINIYKLAGKSYNIETF